MIICAKKQREQLLLLVSEGVEALSTQISTFQIQYYQLNAIFYIFLKLLLMLFT